MEEFKYKHIVRDTMPCWYELSWQAKPPAIILRVRQDFIENVNSLLVDNSDLPIARGLQQEFGFKKFCGDLSDKFGFDDSFVYCGKKNDFVEHLILLPKIKKETGKKCSDCRGKGRKKTFSYFEHCHYCNGTGREFFYDWPIAKAVSASLTVAFILLEFPEKETSAKMPQLMTVRTITQSGMHGGSLGGEFSSFLRAYLASLWRGQTTPIVEITQAMKSAYEFMLGPMTNLCRHDFQAGVFSEFGWLNTDCPGNACGLNPNHNAEYDMKNPDRGYKFSCHNTDTAAQQLTLLAGLAALHDKARREIKSY